MHIGVWSSVFNPLRNTIAVNILKQTLEFVLKAVVRKPLISLNRYQLQAGGQNYYKTSYK